MYGTKSLPRAICIRNKSLVMGSIKGEILVNGRAKVQQTFSRVTGYVEQVIDAGSLYAEPSDLRISNGRVRVRVRVDIDLNIHVELVDDPGVAVGADGRALASLDGAGGAPLLGHPAAALRHRDQGTEGAVRRGKDALPVI
jgi:hypothetical protein